MTNEQHGMSADIVLNLALCLVRETDECLNPCMRGDKYACRWCKSRKRAYPGYMHKRHCPVPGAASFLVKAAEFRPRSPAVRRLRRLKRSIDAGDVWSVRHIHIWSELDPRKGGIHLVDKESDDAI